MNEKQNDKIVNVTEETCQGSVNCQGKLTPMPFKRRITTWASGRQDVNLTLPKLKLKGDAEHGKRNL